MSYMTPKYISTFLSVPRLSVRNTDTGCHCLFKRVYDRTIDCMHGEDQNGCKIMNQSCR